MIGLAETGFKWRIVDVRTMASIATDRRGREDTWITYEYGDGLRDNLIMPSEDATPDAVREKVQEVVRRKLEFIGQEGTVAR